MHSDNGALQEAEYCFGHRLRFIRAKRLEKWVAFLSSGVHRGKGGMDPNLVGIFERARLHLLLNCPSDTKLESCDLSVHLQKSTNSCI
jgi:hypothetical protein